MRLLARGGNPNAKQPARSRIDTLAPLRRLQYCDRATALLWLREKRRNRLIVKKKEELMPGKKHLRGVSAKEQREYEHIKESAQRSGRYGDRAKEVAARTVMKKHKEEGHSKGH
jgi:hypothetical protein